MHRVATCAVCFVGILFVGIVQAQAQFSIRAASAEPVEGWQRMQFEGSDRVVWGRANRGRDRHRHWDRFPGNHSRMEVHRCSIHGRRSAENS